MRSEICQMAVRDVNGLRVLTNMLRTDHDKCKVSLCYGCHLLTHIAVVRVRGGIKIRILKFVFRMLLGHCFFRSQQWNCSVHWRTKASTTEENWSDLEVKRQSNVLDSKVVVGFNFARFRYTLQFTLFTPRKRSKLHTSSQVVISILLAMFMKTLLYLRISPHFLYSNA